MNSKVKINNKLNGILFVLLIFLFVSNSVLVKEYNSIKSISVLMVFLFASAELIIYKKISGHILKAVIIIEGYALFSIINGMINGYQWDESCDRLIRYYIIMPVVVAIITQIYIKRDRFNIFHRALEWSTLLILFFCVGEQAYTLQILPFWPFHEFVNIDGLVLNEIQTNIQMSSETIFSFLLPFYLLMLFDDGEKGVKIYLIFVLMIVYLLMSERKILVIEFIAAILIGAILKIRRRNNNVWSILPKVKIKFIMICAMLGTVTYILSTFTASVEWSVLFDQLIYHLQFGLESDNSGVLSRQMNIIELVGNWPENPWTMLFGHGLNSYTPNSIASDIYKWDYEVFFPAFLFQNGAVGIILLSAMFVGIIKKLLAAYKKTSDNRYIYIAISFVFSLVSATTNPCINEYWFFLLPLSYLTVEREY